LEIMGYAHHLHEVFYPNDMALGSNYTMCSKQEDPTCSDQLDNLFGIFEINANEHNNYYGVNVPEIGINGCK
ncbi:hypothetical protein PENTCL1PPCAC_14824, partial [Pristionchus entomophagus]